MGPPGTQSGEAVYHKSRIRTPTVRQLPQNMYMLQFATTRGSAWYEAYMSTATQQTLYENFTAICMRSSSNGNMPNAQAD
mmetsp:Transcript_84416/g.220469  ORF Transcript_84416/g.220469 Transcript_84416/m.220469 type:complete len:80 (-) Transcript_84416:339-578(-)